MASLDIYMQRCLQLALLGAGNVAPNPMVGAALVRDGRRRAMEVAREVLEESGVVEESASEPAGSHQ